MKYWYKVLKDIIVEDTPYRVGDRILLEEEDANKMRSFFVKLIEQKDKQLKAYNTK